MSQGMASSDQVMVTAGRNTGVRRQLGHEEGWGNPKQAPWLPLLLMLWLDQRRTLVLSSCRCGTACRR